MKYKNDDFEIGGNVEGGFWIYHKDGHYLHHDEKLYSSAWSFKSNDKFCEGWYYSKQTAENTLCKFLEKQNMNCEKDIKQAFADMVKSCGIKVGDKVRVIGKCPSKHMGWSTVWINGTMDKLVGEVLKVVSINARMGIGTMDAYFPPFVLEKVEDICDEPVPTPKHGDIVMRDDYKRIVIKKNNLFYAYDSDGGSQLGPDSITPLIEAYKTGIYKVVGNVFEDKKC